MRDEKLTNWIRKHLGMSELKSVYVNDYGRRSPITKKGFTGNCLDMVLCFNNHSARMSTSEFIVINKEK